MSRITQRERKKLTAVVREAVEPNCVTPEERQRRLEAIDRLYTTATIPAPESLPKWERQYSRLKVGVAIDCLRVTEGPGSHKDG